MPAMIDGDLAQHLAELRQRKGDTVRVEELGDVVRALLESLSGDLTAGSLGLFREVESLAKYIRTAKAEIAALRPADIQATYIASATDELDAIVDATENATNEILDGVERIETLGSALPPEQAQELMDVITRIYEACNFQDITGQRITKVVKALKHIEERVEALVQAFGSEYKDRDGQSVADDGVPDPHGEKGLLNGPQLPETAPNQAAIDALFNN